mgnify:CR=1 FL=1
MLILKKYFKSEKICLKYSTNSWTSFIVHLYSLKTYIRLFIDINVLFWLKLNASYDPWRIVLLIKQYWIYCFFNHAIDFMTLIRNLISNGDPTMHRLWLKLSTVLAYVYMKYVTIFKKCWKLNILVNSC